MTVSPASPPTQDDLSSFEGVSSEGGARYLSALGGSENPVSLPVSPLASGEPDKSYFWIPFRRQDSFPPIVMQIAGFADYHINAAGQGWQVVWICQQEATWGWSGSSGKRWRRNLPLCGSA